MVDINKETSQLIQQEVAMDLHEYWRLFYRKKWAIFGFASLITLISALVVINITPVYRGNSTLIIEPRQANIISVQQIYSPAGSNEYLLTQFEILKSRTLIKKIILKHNLLDHPTFNKQETKLPKQLNFIKDFNNRFVSNYLPNVFPANESQQISAESRLELAANTFLSQLSVSPLRNTQLVNISFDSTDAELAAFVANAVGTTYIEENLAAELELTVKATTWLNDQLSDQRVELTLSEQRLQNFRENEDIIGLNGGLDLAENEIDLVSRKLIDAKRELLELKSQNDQINNIDRYNASELQLIPSILVHPLIRTLKDEVADDEVRRSEIADRYGPKHPRMKAIETELKTSYINLNTQTIAIARSIENEYQVVAEAVKSLERSLAGTRNNMLQLSGKEFRLRELQQNVDTKRTLYDQFYKRLSETSATVDLATANARISEPAIIPSIPVKPNKGLIVALAFVVSFGLALMIAFLLNALDNSIKTSLDVERKLTETLIGILPLLPKKLRGINYNYKQYLDDPHSGYAESIRTIRTGLILSSIDNPYKIISITSAVQGEGKTSVSIALAFSLAQVGNVLLIDADMRRPSIQKALDLGEQKQGLSDLFIESANMEECNMEECIKYYGKGNFDVLTAGTITPNPSELLSSERFKMLLTKLVRVYDKVIIDTAPCQAVSDALTIATLSEACIYVIKSDATDTQHVKNGIKRIRQVNGNIVGIVLNQVDIKKVAQQYGEDYSGYYDTYGYAGKQS
jgi:capsular exopolysaccharide synthesis family protein